jgi:hypothetical protein
MKFKRKVGHFQRSEAPALSRSRSINNLTGPLPGERYARLPFFPEIGTLFDRPHCVGTQDASAGV